MALWYALCVRPHPRIRKTVKWGGSAVTLLLVVVWIGSGWWSWYSQRSQGQWIQIYRGQLSVGESINLVPMSAPRHAPRPGEKVDLMRWVAADRQPTVRIDVSAIVGPLPLRGLVQGFSWTSGTTGWSIRVPLWAPAAMVLLVTGFAWRLDMLARRRARLNLCANCNYDRTGLTPGAVCPECGSALP